MLELKHIHKYYNAGTVNEMCLFNDFNLTIEDHQFVSVVGSNGSGKTSLLNIICGTAVLSSVAKTLPKCRNTSVSAALDAFTRTRLWEPALL